MLSSLNDFFVSSNHQYSKGYPSSCLTVEYASPEMYYTCVIQCLWIAKSSLWFSFYFHRHIGGKKAWRYDQDSIELSSCVWKMMTLFGYSDNSPCALVSLLCFLPYHIAHLPPIFIVHPVEYDNGRQPWWGERSWNNSMKHLVHN